MYAQYCAKQFTCINHLILKKANVIGTIIICIVNLFHFKMVG